MLVDTDVLIWYLRGHEQPARFLESMQKLKLSAITWMELVQGCLNRQELERLKKDLSRRQAVILPVTKAISYRAMALVENHFLGDGLLVADAVIASTAIEHAVTLSSANSKYFRPIADPGIGIAGLRAMKLEIWTRPLLIPIDLEVPGTAGRWTV